MSLSDCEHCWDTHCEHNCAGIVNPAVQKERERILAIVIEEAGRYSRVREDVIPAEVAVVFANAVVSKVRASV